MAELTVDGTGPLRLLVEGPAEVIRAEDASRAFSRELGFLDGACEEIALAVRELATNLVKHARGGVVTLSSSREEGRTGIQIESIDLGPGIGDPERALADGYSTAGSLGTGLGAVHRLMDDLEFRSPETGGTHLICRRWLRAPPDPFGSKRVQVGVASRPRRNETLNGDAFILRHGAGQTLVGVIDGLGHGEGAMRAALCARHYVEEHVGQGLDRLFEGTDRACRSTRGVVMALACFEHGTGSFRFASIGNVEARLFGGPARANLLVRRGILGLNAPRAEVTTHPWGPGSLLVLHSDGLHTHWDWADYPPAFWDTPGEAACRLVQALGKDEDDATVLIARSVTDGA